MKSPAGEKLGSVCRPSSNVRRVSTGRTSGPTDVPGRATEKASVTTAAAPHASAPESAACGQVTRFRPRVRDCEAASGGMLAMSVSSAAGFGEISPEVPCGPAAIPRPADGAAVEWMTPMNR